MKTQDQIKARIRELLNAELRGILDNFDSKLPAKCRHNHRSPLDSRLEVDGDPNPYYNRQREDGSQTIGLCLLGSESPETWTGTICDDPIDAQKCPYYDATAKRQEVIDEFLGHLQDSHWLYEYMPDVYELAWVLASPVGLTWYQKAWYWLNLGVSVSSAPTIDVETLGELLDDASHA